MKLRSERGSANAGFRLIVNLAIVLLILIGVQFRGSLVDKDVAIRALEKQGYSNIEIINHQYFAVGWKGCDSKDAAKFTARVTNPAGKRVEVFVCTGWLFKGATIRTD